jgi:hypothetical protein
MPQRILKLGEENPALVFSRSATRAKSVSVVERSRTTPASGRACAGCRAACLRARIGRSRGVLSRCRLQNCYKHTAWMSACSRLNDAGGGSPDRDFGTAGALPSRFHWWREKCRGSMMSPHCWLGMSSAARPLKRCARLAYPFEAALDGIAGLSVALERLSLHACPLRFDPLGVVDHVGQAVGGSVVRTHADGLDRY